MKARWAAAPVPESAERLQAEGLAAWQAAMLARRGITTAEEAASFLNPTIEALHPPDLLPDLEAAVARLTAAGERGERVAIVGDYDVDGVTASAQMIAVFSNCGLDCLPILPNRQVEGYGFQPIHAERAHEAGCALIVTADCGSTSGPAVERARELGIEVIVTDHHLTDGELPDGTLEVNPNRSDSTYPFPKLCAAGIAFKLVSAMAAHAGRKVPTESLLRMACLGTIADLVPLTGENRVLAALGLAALPNTPSPGLQALMSNARVGSPVTAEDVGYRIGPRINAAGRMAAADRALDLMLTRDPEVARAGAAQLEAWNHSRQAAQKHVTTEAEARWAELDELPPILVAWDEDWHAGVVGISAGQIARKFNRPAVLMQLKDGIAKGSGRSIPGINLHRFLKPWADELERFGGHEQAIGLSVQAGDLERLSGAWAEAAAEWPDELLEKVLVYEFEFPPDALNRDLLNDLRRLEPFGMGNRRPLLRTHSLRLQGPARTFGDGHLKGVARSPSGATLQFLGWRWAAREADLADEFEALGYLEYDAYLRAPVFRLEDARPAGSNSA